MNYNQIKIAIQQAEEILLKTYNIKGTASELPGELDFNFRIKTPNSEGYILKISRPNEEENYLDFQQKLLQYVAENNAEIIAPKVIKDIEGNVISTIIDAFGNVRKVRLLTWISGRVWSSVNPQLDSLRFSLGEQCGLLTKALQGFEHPQAKREFVWDVAQSLWTTAHINLFKNEQKEIISYFQNNFENNKTSYDLLRKSVVHNDANDNNVIVSTTLVNPTVKAAIDYGDAIYTQVINDVAIACAYAVMNHNEPLQAALSFIKGYHQNFPLQEKELAHLYDAIAMRLVISVTKSAINKIEEPNNKYLLISEKPAWEVLEKWREIHPDFAEYNFRIACGFTAHPNEKKFENWSLQHTFSLENLFPTVQKQLIYPLDLSVSSTWIGHEKEANNLALFQFKIDELQKENPTKIIGGGYLEPRVFYTADAYQKTGNNGKESRTIHLGTDFWLPKNTPVHAILDGEVVIASNNQGDKNYGGLLVLKHQADNFEFYTLYGHNSPKSVQKHTIGDRILKGEKIAELGAVSENGNWVPHLHFQVLLSLFDLKTDFPGVAYLKEIEVWKSVCPNPNLLFKSDELAENNTISNNDLIKYRKQHLGKSLSLQYKTPIKMVRGAGQYLIDQFGNKYLDTVNNVAHVGHENYNVVKAGQNQMSLINTNSRYLHENINELAKELIETLPPELNVLHFVNSGSEANELAIRMAKAVTGEKDIIASEIGYHGNANMCIDISSYKFDGKGGNGAPEHTQIFPLVDSFRGRYRGENTAKKYADEVQKCIDTIQEKGRNVGAFIIEPIISCGGQVELPTGFLSEAYQKIRKVGGVCISDEVQTGCGRMGKTFWGFQLHNVVPDIVTIGKPLGNGHPIAAVACTQKVADAFANGMEYFNTFGGNPVSCAIATEVIRTVKRDKLQENALEVGEYLKSALKELSNQFPIIGDVRGQGLFLGVEFVDSQLNPLASQADYVAARMKNHGILMSTDGADHNVLKIKPPIIFTKENAEEVLFYLKKILKEDFMKVD
ncbi:aminotransferase class III-fold pyridoxal phosphate-dependent enzyme [Tenacibaculum finnmarkense]|uniref:aminotransferase class III-fold pyridoxal phosphate-dependent enzyme n=1 Tax=Tenacibaculum finnmarkense TaxID=2781243 RepID=UPI00187B44BA|nr:aminotransferase class III-fold pyridoxal phosphate-dependent enzyme [Tenacibaculum finnmarkense]MBE7659994.1 aminotransferase class III-fold pyridoxal phosphate-dependent enzyme [Tenacibaculum finnmarkense genomovar finnmarkense]MCG8251680.1 aminotransferase class III-fold pyridoxal phosphate-dependent enzyme [Tenacibaculum finnmarkense genomovar finnmarkense]MCG8815208.1 aminotransferase class III-fold pyridoxal phosphate-dependent enzyme [Tenacibaculum finnmarkense]MCG8820233.1 aminotrans